MAGGGIYSIGLKADGTVVKAGKGSADVSGWTNIIDIASGEYHAVGLKSDGTVVFSGESATAAWTDIVAIAAGNHFTVGLKADGTVVACGYNGYGQCNVEDWNLFK